MKAIYPTLQKILIFLLTFIFILTVIYTGTVNAQYMQIAATSKNLNETSYSGNHEIVAQQAIRILVRTDKKVILTWAPFKGGVSHYVLERSFDGRSFEEAGLFFAGDWAEQTDYVYTDKLSSAYKGPLFYRLRVVGFDETEVYTSVSISGEKQYQAVSRNN